GPLPGTTSNRSSYTEASSPVTPAESATNRYQTSRKVHMHTNTTRPLTNDEAHRATDDPELAAHRTAATELGTELRALAEAGVRTTASSERPLHLAHRVRALRED